MSLYHFIGIGGIGMSALAHILVQRGERVQGSDSATTYITKDLKNAGAEIFTYHNPAHLSNVSYAIYSTAIKPSHPEYAAALQHKIPLLHRSELLAELMKGYLALLVTGTHGKTTTSSLLSHVLESAGWNPAFALGGISLNSHSNGKQGKGQYFVAEADESDGTFLKYPAAGAIITNLEEEHLDYWKTKQGLIEGFRQFAKSVTTYLWWCADDLLLRSLDLKGQSYGEATDADLRITRWQQKEFELSFDVKYKGKEYANLSIPLLGRHNALNGAAVFGFSHDLGIDENAIRKAFSTFKGVKRRMEKKGEKDGAVLYDDYAHHPTEIIATLKGLRQAVGERRVVVVFQPHRYSRLRDCWHEFLKAFEDGDLLFVTDIWSAGEDPIPGLEVGRLIEEIRNQVAFPVHYFSRLDLAKGVVASIKPHDVVITLGAGDVTEVCGEILKQ
jgi:UDP-N-acetylmuramate--alanine ligase